VRPFFLIESAYENEHDSTPQSLRAQAYWSVLNGAMGHIFGNCPIWHMSSPSAEKFCGGGAWSAQLNSAGSQSMQYLRMLFVSRAWHTLVPDLAHTVMTAGYGTAGDTDYAASALTGDRATFIAYLPSSRRVTIDLTRMTGSEVRATWFDPARGTAQAAGQFTTRESTTLSPPKSGDWVLLLDDVAQSLAIPGG
jgi:Protein of unknown function (DUF4038)/Putative collagen-binding domain of a collagenase